MKAFLYRSDIPAAIPTMAVAQMATHQQEDQTTWDATEVGF